MKDPKVQVSFRLPVDLVRRLDEAAEDLSKELGFTVSKTDAVTKMILIGLASHQPIPKR